MLEHLSAIIGLRVILKSVMAVHQNLVVLLDGQRLNENELTGIKWSSIPINSIERIEIMRGAGAVLYGAGATGGVINIITRTPGRKPTQKRLTNGETVSAVVVATACRAWHCARFAG